MVDLPPGAAVAARHAVGIVRAGIDAHEATVAGDTVTARSATVLLARLMAEAGDEVGTGLLIGALASVATSMTIEATRAGIDGDRLLQHVGARVAFL